MDDAKINDIKEKIEEIEKHLNDAESSRHGVYKVLERNLDSCWVGDEDILTLERDLDAAFDTLRDLKEMLDMN